MLIVWRLDARRARGGLASLAAFAAALLLLFNGGVAGALLLFLLFALDPGRAPSCKWRKAPANALQISCTRTLEDHGAAILFAGLAAMITALPPGTRRSAMRVCDALYGLIGRADPLSGLHRRAHLYWRPPRRSVEEIYRAGCFMKRATSRSTPVAI